MSAFLTLSLLSFLSRPCFFVSSLNTAFLLTSHQFLAFKAAVHISRHHSASQIYFLHVPLFCFSAAVLLVILSFTRPHWPVPCLFSLLRHLLRPSPSVASSLNLPLHLIYLRKKAASAGKLPGWVEGRFS